MTLFFKGIREFSHNLQGKYCVLKMTTLCQTCNIRNINNLGELRLAMVNDTGSETLCTNYCNERLSENFKTICEFETEFEKLNANLGAHEQLIQETTSC
jgi:hypothetical protein